MATCAVHFPGLVGVLLKCSMDLRTFCVSRLQHPLSLLSIAHMCTLLQQSNPAATFYSSADAPYNLLLPRQALPSFLAQDSEDATGPAEGWALQDDLVEQNAALKATVADCRSKLSQADAQASDPPSRLDAMLHPPHKARLTHRLTKQPSADPLSS